MASLSPSPTVHRIVVDHSTTVRPALSNLIAAMGKLSRRQRLEIADRGRKAKAAKTARIRRLTRAVTAEVRRLMALAAD